MHFLKEIPLCGNRTELNIPPDGYESVRIINLRPSEEFVYCSMTIRVPVTHVIHLQFLEDAGRIKHKPHQSVSIPCNLHIYVEDMMKPIWQGDLCTSEPLKSVDMLSSKATIRWESSHDKLQTKGRKIIVTAVGHGEYCRKPNQHTCMKIGFEPIFCVSADVTCDGHENCPSGSKTSDEGIFCETDQLWTKRFMGVLNKMPNIANTIRKVGYAENSTDLPKMINDIGRTWNNIKRLTKIETTTRPAPEAKTFSTLHDLLSQYDPWGYLCLGVVLCGTLFLMCYGVWECCIRRYKLEPFIPSPSQPATTVLIVNNYDENGVPQPQPPQMGAQQPPNYDELDLPPSYTALFPNKPPDERHRSVNTPTTNEVIAMDSINLRQAHNTTATTPTSDTN